MRKHQNFHLKVLLLLTVYLFFSIANAFFTSKQIVTSRRQFSFKPAAEGAIHIPKTSKAAITQPRVSVSQLVQSAAQFFIVLFFCVGLLTVCFEPVVAARHYRPDSHNSYLRHCVIRI